MRKQCTPFVMACFTACTMLAVSDAMSQRIVVTDAKRMAIENGAPAGLLPATTYPVAVVGDIKPLTYRIHNDSETPLNITLLETWGPASIGLTYSSYPSTVIEPFSSTEATLRFEANTVGTHNVQIIIHSNSISDSPFVLNLRCTVTNEPIARPDLDLRFQTNLKTKWNRRTGMVDIKLKGVAANYGTAVSSGDYALFYVTDKSYFDGTATLVGIAAIKPMALPKPGKAPKSKKVNFKFSTSVWEGHVYMVLVPGEMIDSDWSSNMASMFFNSGP